MILLGSNRVSVGSTSPYVSEYEINPDDTGTLPESQPGFKHGVMYVPRGMRWVVKTRKLEF